MGFIKNIFIRIHGWLVRPITYVVIKIVELTAPVIEWAFRNVNAPAPSMKSWMKLVLGFALFLLTNSLISAFFALAVTFITFVLAIVLPVALANLIAMFAVGFYLYHLISLAINNCPDEITVAV